MNHITYVDKSTYTTALLIKDTSFNSKEIKSNYSIDWNDSICLSLAYENGKAPSKLIKSTLKTVLKACEHLGVTHLLVCDTNYFKVLTKQSKAEPMYGSVCNCVLNPNMKVILAPNYQALFYNPTVQSKLDLAINTLKSDLNGTHLALGDGIIKFAEYPTGDNISTWLNKLLDKPMLTCDVETTGLDFKAELLSISFAWNQHEGIAFAITNESKYDLLDFFEKYTGTLMYHRASFDCTRIIYNLFMGNDLDYKGMLHGLNVVATGIEDTQILTYLATNSTAGNDLKLKNLALEFAGNFAILSDEVLAQDIPTDQLLTYNLTDALATWYLYNKFMPVVIQDQQLDIYRNIMLPSIKSIVHMQLVGFPMDINQVDKTQKELLTIQNKWQRILDNSKIIKKYEWNLQVQAFTKKNSELKVKHIPIGEFKTKFNPGSGKQLAGLLYDNMKFDVINLTDTGQPATDRDTLESLYNQLMHQHNLTEEDLK